MQHITTSSKLSNGILMLTSTGESLVNDILNNNSNSIKVESRNKYENSINNHGKMQGSR